MKYVLAIAALVLSFGFGGSQSTDLANHHTIASHCAWYSCIQHKPCPQGHMCTANVNGLVVKLPGVNGL